MKRQNQKYKVTHIMADGEERDSIEGAIIPLTMTGYYSALENIFDEKMKKIHS
ncbi:BOW99_gp33 family protein [Floricoccus tropicus]|uniref:BOW99_gp33 family protein n=1 Tax=Floricoccus tropicus TaxID=1859473 RepID=UPI0013013566|nr:hypothetical protein [Floricoccus tropicus]